MRKTQFDQNEMIDFDAGDLDLNLNMKMNMNSIPNSNPNQNNLFNNNNRAQVSNSNANTPFIDFHSNSSNLFKIHSSYDINQLTKNESPQSLLKVKVNPNTNNELAIIGSNFKVLSMSIRNDSLFHQTSTLIEHKSRINDISYFKNTNEPFNTAFVSCSNDGTIKIWDSRTEASIKTIIASKGKKVFTVDTSNNLLAAGMEREIGIYDLKMMKPIYKAKFGHSEDVTYIKIKDSFVISGGEDSVVNVFDISNGFDMNSVLATSTVNQPVTMLNTVDDEFNYLQVISTVQTYHILNMFTGVSNFDFDAKSDSYKTDYMLESYYEKDLNLVRLFCGNFYGDIVQLSVNVDNKEVKCESVIKTGVVQCFNHMDRMLALPNCYVTVSDEGYLYFIDQNKAVGEFDIAKSNMDELMMMDDLEEYKEEININPKKKKNVKSSFTPY